MKSKKTLEKELEKTNLCSVWDEVYFFDDCFERHENGTMQFIQKLLGRNDKKIRYGFCYQIDGCYHTEYIYSEKDYTSNKQLVRIGKKLYDDIVSKMTFTEQPYWND